MTRGEYETLLVAQLALFNLVASFDPASHNHNTRQKGPVERMGWDVPAEWLEATVARMMRARPSTPDRTPLLSLPAAWLEPLRRPPPEGAGGGGGGGFMRLEALVGQLQAHCEGEGVALVAVEHDMSCALGPQRPSLPDLQASFARGLTALRTAIASRAAAPLAPPQQAPAPTFNVEAAEFVPAVDAEAEVAKAAEVAEEVRAARVQRCVERCARHWRGRVLQARASAAAAAAGRGAGGGGGGDVAGGVAAGGGGSGRRGGRGRQGHARASICRGLGRFWAGRVRGVPLPDDADPADAAAPREGFLRNLETTVRSAPCPRLVCA